MSKQLIHAIQLEFAYQWYHANVNEDCQMRNKARETWFNMMRRANCAICDGPISE